MRTSPLSRSIVTATSSDADNTTWSQASASIERNNVMCCVLLCSHLAVVTQQGKLHRNLPLRSEQQLAQALGVLCGGSGGKQLGGAHAALQRSGERAGRQRLASLQ